MAQHNTVGKEGEQIALETLLKAGYTVRETNWRSGKHEIDIIAQKDAVLIIVEVKTRTSEYFDRPEDAVTLPKIKRMIAATEAYIRLNDLPFEVQFDIISIIKRFDGWEVDHIQDAFYPPLY